MTVIDAELQICPGFGWVGGPVFSTRIVALKSGVERRNANNAYPRHSYTLPLNNIKSSAYLLELKHAFMAAMGSLYAFKAKDYNDFQLQDEPFGVGDGTTKVFYLQKAYYFGTQTFIRPITKPVAGIAITANHVAVAPTVDTQTGAVTFATAPLAGQTLRSTGEFRVPVRFTNDALSVTIDAKFQAGDYAINGSVDLMEVFE